MRRQALQPEVLTHVLGGRDISEVLVAAGKSVIVIEHNQAVMARAAGINDLGPAAGRDGAEATPAAGGSEMATSVQIVDFAFEPALEITTGTTVTWTNVGGQPHTATAEDGSFDTGVLTTDMSGSHTFTEPGTYPYVCTLHENTMQAVLVVT